METRWAERHRTLRVNRTGVDASPSLWQIAAQIDCQQARYEASERKPHRKPASPASMRLKDIKRHLSPYSIYGKRKTTINHAFAAAVAPCDEFEVETMKRAICLLGQDPESDLFCAYCDSRAETWDHVFATVKDSVFSGAGHRVGNLLPCCKPCNSKKGNKSWESHLDSLGEEPALRAQRASRIRRFLEAHFKPDKLPDHLPEYDRFLKIRDDVLELMRQADLLATEIRSKMST